MKKQGFAAFLRRKQYVIAGAVVVIAAIGTTVLYSNKQEEERQQLEAELAEEQQEQEAVAAEEDAKESAEAAAVIPPKTDNAENAVELEDLSGLDVPEASLEDTTQVADVPANSEVTQQTGSHSQTLHFSPEDGMLWPMEGNVILNYSMDSTVYFATLDQYKYNPAVIIEGEVNDKVYSVAKGQVTDVSSNEVTGCTMTVDLGDGYQVVYGQLKEPNFEVGDYVESGHVLGFVAEPTKYFSVEGSNLYFALEKDGEPIDPIEFFE